MMNNYLREVIKEYNYNTVLSQVFCFLYGLETQPGSYGIFGVFFGLFCGAY